MTFIPCKTFSTDIEKSNIEIPTPDYYKFDLIMYTKVSEPHQISTQSSMSFNKAGTYTERDPKTGHANMSGPNTGL